jgi:chorismate mutase
MADPNDPGDWRGGRPPSGPVASALETTDRAAALAAIDALRDEIDRLDAELVQLLNQRAAQALEIGRIKRTLKMEIYQPAREEAVLRHVRGINPGPLDGDAVARLFERIIDEARRLERMTGAADAIPSPGLRPASAKLRRGLDEAEGEVGGEG